MPYTPIYKPRLPLNVKRSLEGNSVSSPPPSPTIIALSTIVAILGVIIITGVVIWRVKVYRNTIRQRASTDTLVTLSELEKNNVPPCPHPTAGAISNPSLVPTRIHTSISSGLPPYNGPASPAFSLGSSTSTLSSNPPLPKLESLRMSLPNSALPEDPDARWRNQAKLRHLDQETNQRRRESLASSVHSGTPLDTPARGPVGTRRLPIPPVGDGNAGSSPTSRPGAPKEDREKAEPAARKPTASPPPSCITSNSYNDSWTPHPAPMSPSPNVIQSTSIVQQDARSKDKILASAGPVSTSEPRSKPQPRRTRSPLKPISIPPPLKLPPIPVQSPTSTISVSPKVANQTITTPNSATPYSTGLQSRFSLSSVNYPSDTATITYELQDTPLPSPARSESFAVRDPAFPGSPTLQRYAKARIQLPSSALARGVSPSSRNSDVSGFSRISMLSVPGVVATATRVSSTTATTAALQQIGRSPFGSVSSETINSANSWSSKLPRPMAVLATFTPSLEDEMQVKMGETVRLISEFEDGWCLVERLVGGPKRGSGDTDKGAVDVMDGVRKGVCPRFCLGEVKVL